jgi:hypothetical protein
VAVIPLAVKPVGGGGGAITLKPIALPPTGEAAS